jgi:hypothetical protein
MKNGLFKLSTLGLLLISATSFANNLSNTTQLQASRFSISLTGLYLEPSASNLTYAIYTTPLPLPAPNWQQKIVNPAYSGAFDLGMQYTFIGDKDKLKLNWLHFNSKDSASATSSPSTSVGPVYYYGPAEQFILNTYANSTVKFDIEDGNFTFNHLISLSPSFQLEPFIGLSVAYLKEDLTNNYYGTDPVYGPYSHNVYGKSKFTGAGPRLGMDTSYFITNHFAITAQLAGELLAGSLKYSTDFTSLTGYVGTTAHNNTPTNTSMANQSLSRAVPELGAKLGVLYTLPFKNSESELTFQAGYMYSVYFNAIHEVLPQTLVTGSWEAGTVAIVNQTQRDSNLDLKGPYLSVSMKF